MKYEPLLSKPFSNHSGRFSEFLKIAPSILLPLKSTPLRLASSKLVFLRQAPPISLPPMYAPK